MKQVPLQKKQDAVRILDVWASPSISDVKNESWGQVNMTHYEETVQQFKGPTEQTKDMMVRGDAGGPKLLTG